MYDRQTSRLRPGDNRGRPRRGTTIEQMEAGYQVMCPNEAGPSESGCNLAGVMQCIPTEDSDDTSELDICR